MRNLRGLKVLVATSTFSKTDKVALNLLERAGLEVKLNPFKRKLSKAELMDLLGGDTVGLIAGLETLDKEVLEGSRLKVISRCGVGMDNLDLKAAKRLHIKVYSTPDSPTVAVAELTVGVMLSLLRSIPCMDRDMHKGNWNKMMGLQLNGKTVAIIGFGRIGRYVAKLIYPFGVNILAVDPQVRIKTKGVQFTTLKKAVSLADIITVHANSAKEILGENEFKLMKKSAFLLNSSRARLINEAALIKAIDSKRLNGAWLDVFNDEPYNGPLRKYEQIILTPHAGSYSRECRLKMETEATENLIAGLRQAKMRRK